MENVEINTMPTDNPENDHDYVDGGIRNINVGIHNVIPRIVLRLLRSSNIQQGIDTGESPSAYAPNSDHNYINLYPMDTLTDDNVGTVTTESDQDIFDDEDDEVSGAINDVNSRSSSSAIYESGKFEF